MNRRILTVIILCFLTILPKAEFSRILDAKTLSSFKVFLTNYFEPDSIRDKIPVFEYDSRNGYTFYKTEFYYTSKKEKGLRLVLTSEKKPIKLKQVDKEYYSDLYNTIYYCPSPYFVCEGNVSFIIITVFFPDNINDQYGKFSAIETKIFNKENNNKSKKVVWENNPTQLKVGAVCYIDSSYCLEWGELSNDNYFVSRREALNPDDYGLDTSKIPGLGNTNCVQYYSSFKFGNGYVKLIPGNDIYYINGKEYDFNKQTDKLIPVVIKDNQIMIYYSFLEGILNAQSQGIFSKLDEKKKVLQIQRLYYSNKQKAIQTLKVDFAQGNKQYLDNDKLKTFPIAPYNSNVGLMVPLKEVCDALKAKVIFRPLDGSILIARFFEE